MLNLIVKDNLHRTIYAIFIGPSIMGLHLVRSHEPRKVSI